VAWVFDSKYLDPATGKRGKKIYQRFSSHAAAKGWPADATRDVRHQRIRATAAQSDASEGAALPAARTVYSERLREDILTLRKRGLVPLAIADVLDISDHTASAHLRRLVAAGDLESIPGYLTHLGPVRETEVCTHCGC
jgi:DNA-binding NarL/FixJ family response regulator